MNIKKIYLIRHGQTDFNKKGIVQGSGVDASLNDTGRAQAEAFFKVYGKVAFDKVYTSALRRTQESVRGFLLQGLPHESLSTLNEISWGIREGALIDEAANRYYYQMLNQWKMGKTEVAIEGGESPDDVAKRLRTGLGHIMQRTNEETVLICMHGRAMRILLCLMLNYPLKAMDLFEHDNLGLYELIHTGSTFRVEKYNDVGRLG